MTVGGVLHAELKKRQGRNPRYSLRAFARDLRLHHSTLSRIIRGRQRVKASTLAHVATRLGLEPELVHRSAIAEIDHAVLSAVERAGFRAQTRWIAAVTGIAIDEVNLALHRLLRDRRLAMESRDRWVRIATS